MKKKGAEKKEQNVKKEKERNIYVVVIFRKGKLVIMPTPKIKKEMKRGSDNEEKYIEE